LLLVGFFLFLAWLEKVPVRIAHSHSTDRKTGGVVAAANHLGLALNRALARAFSTQGVGCSAEAGAALFGRHWQKNTKYRLIHCGIDLTPFETVNSLASLRMTLGIEPGAEVIGHVGSFSVVKNHRFLVEVAARVLQKRADAVMLLVGDGELRPVIEKACAELGIRRRVIFAGVSSHVPELMRSAMDVFVMPSFHEGLPLVLLEAQAAGLPCMVSDVVSREAMVSEESIRFLPLSAGPEFWADAIVSLLESPPHRRDLLKLMYNSDFNIVTSADQLLPLYNAARIGCPASAGF
jgi:glycosyltransferase involved in cell wall biosynthesis